MFSNSFLACFISFSIYSICFSSSFVKKTYFGVNVVKVSSSAELQKVMSKAVNGLEIVIIQVPDREVNAKELKAISQSISSAVRIGINLA